MSEKLNILVVEDEPNLRDALCLAIECAGHRVIGAADGPQALRMLERNTGEHALNLVITDLKMQPMDGLTLLREIRAREPVLPVLLMTAFGDVEKAVAAMRAGACDFLLKPFEPDVLLAHIDRYAAPVVAPTDMVAEDARTRQVLGLASRVAKSEATVLLTGESGTGKEVFARYIHQQSARAGKPFIAINCAAIPDNLLEATLFGYERAPSPAPRPHRPASSNRPTAALCCSMKFPKCRFRCRPSCCACCRSARSNASAARSRCRWTSAYWPPATATWKQRRAPAASARICTTG